MKKIRHLSEYVLTRLGLALIDSLSAPNALSLATRLARTWYALDKNRRQISIANILKSKITSDHDEAVAIARDSFGHFAQVVVESLKSSDFLPENKWRDRVELDFPSELMDDLKNRERGIILASGHFGSWELAAQLLSRFKPVVGITRRLNNPYTDRLMQKRKPSDGFRLTPKRSDDSSRFLATLKRGEVLAFMIDQHARNRGMMVDFFGTPASTHTAIALLHLVTRAPLYFGFCLRTSPMTFKVKAVGPILQQPSGNRSSDIRKVLERLNMELENAIRANPGQYLWAHRRWRDHS